MLLFFSFQNKFFEYKQTKSEVTEARGVVISGTGGVWSAMGRVMEMFYNDLDHDNKGEHMVKIH